MSRRRAASTWQELTRTLSPATPLSELALFLDELEDTPQGHRLLYRDLTDPVTNAIQTHVQDFEARIQFYRNHSSTDTPDKYLRLVTDANQLLHESGRPPLTLGPIAYLHLRATLGDQQHIIIRHDHRLTWNIQLPSNTGKEAEATYRAIQTHLQHQSGLTANDLSISLIRPKPTPSQPSIRIYAETNTDLNRLQRVIDQTLAHYFPNTRIEHVNGNDPNIGYHEEETNETDAAIHSLSSTRTAASSFHDLAKTITPNTPISTIAIFLDELEDPTTLREIIQTLKWDISLQMGDNHMVPPPQTQEWERQHTANDQTTLIQAVHHAEELIQRYDPQAHGKPVQPLRPGPWAYMRLRALIGNQDEVIITRYGTGWTAQLPEGTDPTAFLDEIRAYLQEHEIGHGANFHLSTDTRNGHPAITIEGSFRWQHSEDMRLAMVHAAAHALPNLKLTSFTGLRERDPRP